MSDDPYFLDSLELSGFRAFLEPQLFNFGTKRCLAVFAPNGLGKSSIVDALEFMFSDDGTLERLGLRAINNQAGMTALAHNLAEEKDITPFVRAIFKRGKKKHPEGLRIARGLARTPRPAIADAVNASFTVAPLIRGYSLRHFVEEQKAEERYRNVARWLQLGPLVDVQQSLRLLRRRTKAAAADRDALNRVDIQLKKKSVNAVEVWNEEAVQVYANSILAPLDEALSLKSLDRTDLAFITVKERAETEERQLGLEGRRQVRRTATNLYEEKENPDTGDTCKAGLLPDFAAAIDVLETAEKAEAEERNAAANAVFDDLWKAAEPLFAEGRTALDKCPVCRTPIADSTAGSVEGVRQHIATHRAKLTNYANAKEKLEDASAGVVNIRTELIAGLKSLTPLLPEEHAALENTLAIYLNAVTSWNDGAVPDAAKLKTSLHKLTTTLDTTIAEIEAKQGANTYIKALSKLNELIDLKDERECAVRLLAELEKLSKALNIQAAHISSAIRNKVQALLDTLREPVNEIYRQIQGDSAAPIRLELPSDDDVNQQRLNLVINFAANREGVHPGGYLSDSQIHSLALALRLAAIKRFNFTAPIIALDDIVTSYDANHRRTIAAMLAKEFRDFQLIVMTHDERFFIYLKDQLEDKHWHYRRITRLDPDYGPRFIDHRVTEGMIEARWHAGESAANEMRQAEEEWLLGLCRDFDVKLHIRPVERAYSYERSELAQAVATFLTRKDLTPPLVPGVNNRFLTSLQRGVVENFGSHFQDGPYGEGSIGDEKARWEEFKVFRDIFVCPKCGRTRFKRPNGMKMAVCKKDDCETQFAFKKPDSSASEEI